VCHQNPGRGAASSKIREARKFNYFIKRGRRGETRGLCWLGSQRIQDIPTIAGSLAYSTLYRTTSQNHNKHHPIPCPPHSHGLRNPHSYPDLLNTRTVSYHRGSSSTLLAHLTPTHRASATTLQSRTILPLLRTSKSVPQNVLCVPSQLPNLLLPSSTAREDKQRRSFGWRQQ